MSARRSAALATAGLLVLLGAARGASAAADAWRGDVPLMTANFTGALRLLTGVGWPMIWIVFAVSERLRTQGYAPDGAPRPVQNSSGLRGVQLRFVRDGNGRVLRYWVTVFVRDSGFLRRGRVFIVEAGGDREVFDRAIPAVERAIATFST